MRKPPVALDAVHDIFARDHAGIAACSKLIRDALEKEIRSECQFRQGAFQGRG